MTVEHRVNLDRYLRADEGGTGRPMAEAMELAYEVVAPPQVDTTPFRDKPRDLMYEAGMVEMSAVQEQIMVEMRSGRAQQTLKAEALVSILEAKAASRKGEDLEASANIWRRH